MTVTQVVAALTSLFTWYFFSDTASDPEGYVRDKNVSDPLKTVLHSCSYLVTHSALTTSTFKPWTGHFK